MCCADASFLVSAFLGDEHGTDAWRWWQSTRQVLTVSRLALFEAENAIRAAPHCGKCTLPESKSALDGLVRARLEGFIERQEVPVRRLYPEAQRLSTHHTGPEVYGAMDILHVAAAHELGATQFASFDLSQRKLASATGLEVVP